MAVSGSVYLRFVDRSTFTVGSGTVGGVYWVVEGCAIGVDVEGIAN